MVRRRKRKQASPRTETWLEGQKSLRSSPRRRKIDRWNTLLRWEFSSSSSLWGENHKKTFWRGKCVLVEKKKKQSPLLNTLRRVFHAGDVISPTNLPSLSFNLHSKTVRLCQKPYDLFLLNSRWALLLPERKILELASTRWHTNDEGTGS